MRSGLGSVMRDIFGYATCHIVIQMVLSGVSVASELGLLTEIVRAPTRAAHDPVTAVHAARLLV